MTSTLQNTTNRPRFSTKKTRCESCGENLDGYDMCPSCGRLNL